MTHKPPNGIDDAQHHGEHHGEHHGDGLNFNTSLFVKLEINDSEILQVKTHAAFGHANMMHKPPNGIDDAQHHGEHHGDSLNFNTIIPLCLLNLK